MSGDLKRTQTVSTSHLLGWITAAVGASVLVGWAFDVPGLKAVIPGTVSMKSNTALAFVLAGLSLAVVPTGPRSRLLIQGLAGGTALLGLATLAQYLLAVDLGIDQLLFQEPAGAVGTLAPNRMAPTTAVAFALVGASRWLVASPRTIAAGQRIALVAGFLGFLSVAAYLCGATDLLGVGRYTQMAANTAVLFVLLAAGLLLLHSREGILSYVAVGTPSRWLLRRMLPIVIALPLGIGWLGVTGTLAGKWTPQFAIALVVVLLVVVLASITYWAARDLSASEGARREAEAEQRKLQERLHQSARLAALGTLVAGVAHEINNPLTAELADQGLAREVVGDLREQIAARSPVDRDAALRLLDQVDEVLADAQASGARVARIVKDMATLSRPDASRTRTGLAEIVGEALRWLPSGIDPSTIRVEDEGAPEVIVSSGQIQQVLVNLLTNAAKAAPAGSAPDVRVRLAPGGAGIARVEVIDHGVGIDPAIQGRIFDPFFTTRPSGEGRGAGLGLAICHAIVEAHGGNLTVESVAGKGSKFRVELPAA